VGGVIAAAAHMQDAAMPSDGRARWLGRDAFAGKLEGCLRGVVGRAHVVSRGCLTRRETRLMCMTWQGFTFESILFK
jgi:hypothetical protein